MNTIAFIGFICAIGIMLFGIMLGSPLIIFFDLTAVLLGPVATLMLLIATFGFGPVGSAFRTGFWGLFFASDEPPHPEQVKTVQMVAGSGINYSTLTGFIGGLIGLTQMLTNMADPTAIGPALAVCLLSAFYAVAMVMFVYYPMARNADRAT